MTKSVFNLPKAAFCKTGKKIEDFLNCSIKDIYNKIFLNHLQKDLTDDWAYKNSSNIIVQHPSKAYSVTVLNASTEFRKDLYAISLLPMGFWLVRENNCVVELRKSSLYGELQKLLTATGNSTWAETSPNASLLTDILTHVRPTGLVVASVNCLRPLISLGNVRTSLMTDTNPMVFVPYHRGFPEVLLGLDCLDTTQRSSNRACQIVEWQYLGQPYGRLLPRLPFDYEPLSIFSLERHANPIVLSLQQVVQREMQHHGVVDRPFPPKSLKFLAQSGVSMDTSISQEERARRHDCTDKLIISIDPVDAKDLDDALHIETLDNGQFEVGVHIADVGHYVQSGSPVDREALTRANSVYLKHKVIPMLPEVLSEELCSLNPGKQKLAFSVLFVLDRNGEVISERFVKTVIQPRVRLNYDQANAIIEGRDVPELRPNVHSEADYLMAIQSVQQLHRLATQIRARRVQSGALVLTKNEVKFAFDPSISPNEHSGSFPEPIGFKVKQSGNSNYLIEEFMLLANQASAKLLFSHLLAHPDSKSKLGAMLRKHARPDKMQLFRMANYMRLAGLGNSVSGRFGDVSKVQEHIAALKEAAPARSLGLNYSLYFCMQIATYCCAEDAVALNDPDQKIVISNDVDFPFHHFGLNVPLYTHFTSPIRRYADIVVHRQLDAIVNGKKGCGTALSQRLEAAYNCNFNRLNARRLDERLTSIYMAALLHKEGWRLDKAIVLQEYQNSVTVLLPDSGIIHRCEMCHFAPWAFGFETKVVSVSEPLEIRLKYLSERNMYTMNTDNGFVQYSFQRPLTVSAVSEGNDDGHEMTEVGSHLDDSIDVVQRGARLKDEENRRLEAMKFSVHQFQFFSEVDCIVYCARDQLKLVVELPCPLGRSELLSNRTRDGSDF